jgi:hypothetical protein
VSLGLRTVRSPPVTSFKSTSISPDYLYTAVSPYL